MMIGETSVRLVTSGDVPPVRLRSPLVAVRARAQSLGRARRFDTVFRVPVPWMISERSAQCACAIRAQSAKSASYSKTPRERLVLETRDSLTVLPRSSDRSAFGFLFKLIGRMRLVVLVVKAHALSPNISWGSRLSRSGLAANQVTLPDIRV